MKSNSRRNASGMPMVFSMVATMLLCAFVVVYESPEKTAYVAGPDNVVLTWNEQVFGAMRVQYAAVGKPTQPTVGARNFAVVHTCMYDAWAAYDDKAEGWRTKDALRRPRKERTPANKRAAVSYAAHTALVDLFPAQRATFDAVLAGLGYPAEANLSRTAPSAIGTVACQAVLGARHADGANQLGQPAYSDPKPSYAPVNPPQPMDRYDPSTMKQPDRWTPVDHGHGDVQSYMTPHYGSVAPFVLESVGGYAPPAPPPFGSPDANAAIDKMVDVSARLTDRQKAIVEHWLYKAETSTGIGQEWARFVSERDRHTLDDDVKMFFALSVAAHDENVVLWKTKRDFDYGRPIMMVRAAKQGQPIQAWGGPGVGTTTIDGTIWRPYVMSPPFAAYVSGHAATASASAELLRLYSGSSAYGGGIMIPAGSSTVEPGITPASPVRLHWPTFEDAAREVADSRLYGGVHFEQDNVEGTRQGRRVAGDVWRSVQRYFDGTA